MEYAEVATIDCDYRDPAGRSVTGWDTEEVSNSGTFGRAVHALVLAATDRTYGNPRVLMTTRDHWSGYSEYTITNTWSEIVLTVPEWNWEREWSSLGDFLRTLADANPEADR